MGVVIDETTTVTKIVSSLPDKYIHFQKAWDSVPEANQTMANLLSRLRKEELERKQALASSSEKEVSKKSAAFVTDTRGLKKDPKIAAEKKKTSCHQCGFRGHWKRECRTPPHKWKHRQDEQHENSTW